MAALRWLAQFIIATLTVVAVGVLATQLLAPSQTSTTSTVGLNHPVLTTPLLPEPPPIKGLTRDTGMDTQACSGFDVCGTDLGIPFSLPDGSVGYLFGDTFTVPGPFLELPPGADIYRPQALLRSAAMPISGQPIIFDGAAGIGGQGIAPELLHHGHLILNDGVALPDNKVIVSYQGMLDGTPEGAVWQTDQSGLAVSYDGGNTFQLAGPIWRNNADNSDPYQMWSMQRDGQYIYIISTRAGRQPGPMMLLRVRTDQMLDQDADANATAYEYWNGSGWGPKEQATPVQNGIFGEPSLRKLNDGTWVMAYTEYTGGAKIVTRTAPEPTGPWSAPKVQLTWQQMPALYGGFIHPWSTASNLILMVSAWQRQDDGTKHGKLVRYDVSHFIGSL